MKKYVCIGGKITSKSDGDIHYISPHRVSELYKVNPEECYFTENDNASILNALRLEELIILRPDYHGNYDPLKFGEGEQRMKIELKKLLELIETKTTWGKVA